jgi:hypothetical protein
MAAATRTTRSSSQSPGRQSDATVRDPGSMPAFRTVVSVLVRFVVRSFSTNSRPALRAASGRPPARQRHDGYRGPASPSTRGEPHGRAQRRDSADGVWASRYPPPGSYPTKPAASKSLRGRSQSGSALRKRSASVRSFAATSAARSACSLAASASGPPCSARVRCTRDLLLDLGDRLCRRSHLFSQRLALGLRLLGSLEQIGVVGVRSAMTDRYPSPAQSYRHSAGWGHWGHIGATSHPTTTDNTGQRRSPNVAAR